jgi:hypothetical protein
MKWDYIYRYMEANGRYPKTTVSQKGKIVYDFYVVAQKAGYPVANPIGAKADYDKIVNYISSNTGVERAFVEMFFRALYGSIQAGENSPGDLFVSTAKSIQAAKVEEIKEKFGINIFGKYVKIVLAVAGLGAAAVILVSIKPITRGLPYGKEKTRA